jgi:hypothetical protein
MDTKHETDKCHFASSTIFMQALASRLECPFQAGPRQACSQRLPVQALLQPLTLLTLASQSSMSKAKPSSVLLSFSVTGTMSAVSSTGCSENYTQKDTQAQQCRSVF